MFYTCIFVALRIKPKASSMVHRHSPRYTLNPGPWAISEDQSKDSCPVRMKRTFPGNRSPRGKCRFLYSSLPLSETWPETERSVSPLFPSKVNCKTVPLTSSKKASWSSLRKAFGAPGPHIYCWIYGKLFFQFAWPSVRPTGFLNLRASGNIQVQTLNLRKVSSSTSNGLLEDNILVIYRLLFLLLLLFCQLDTN